MDDHSARFETALDFEATAASHDLATRLVEAALFASAEPVSARALLAMLAPLDRTDVEAIVARVAARHEGSGLCVQAVGGGWQFRTAPDLAPFLTQVQKRPRRLPRATMETWRSSPTTSPARAPRSRRSGASRSARPCSRR